MYISSDADTDSASEGNYYLVPSIPELPNCEPYSQTPPHENILTIYIYIYIYIYYIINRWAVSPIQYLLRQKISIVDTFVFVFVSIIKIIKVFLIVSISHK